MEFCLYLIAHLHIIIESVDMKNAMPSIHFYPEIPLLKEAYSV
jgi:hypothetical protein